MRTPNLMRTLSVLVGIPGFLTFDMARSVALRSSYEITATDFCGFVYLCYGSILFHIIHGFTSSLFGVRVVLVNLRLLIGAYPSAIDGRKLHFPLKFE